MNNALEIREVFKQVYAIDRPKHTDVINAMREMRPGGCPEFAVRLTLIKSRNRRNA